MAIDIDVQALHPDYDRGPHKAAMWLVGTIALLLLFLVLWMAFAHIDISAQGSGKVMPSDRLQTIQSLEGGIIESIAVHEGQRVAKGDLLATVRNTQFDADLGETRQALWGAQAAIIRLDAELGGNDPVFPEALRQQAPDLVAKEQALWASRREELSTTVDTLRSQKAQRERELSEARARAASFRAQLAIARETLAIETRLNTSGAGARADLLGAQQQVASLQGELNAAYSTMKRLEAGITEAEARLSETRARFMAEASRERSEAELQLATLREQLPARADRVSRRELRASLDGVVNRILLSTVGGVAGPGETVMELVPDENRLIINARIKPSDIAFIRPGQQARVRVSAYDSSIFGSLEAKVIRVGADALTEERTGEVYFDVALEATNNYVGEANEHLSISPGMTTDVSILTGKRTVLEYLLKPIVKTFDTSLRER